MANMKRKAVSGIVLMLLLTSMLSSAFIIEPVKAEPATIIVPDDYPTIQQAINAANPGDTIYVKAGTYYENVVIGKPVSLIGENRQNTIIDGNYAETVVKVWASNVNITGFTIRNSKRGVVSPLFSGIYVYYARGFNISHNIITNNDCGIWLDRSSKGTVSDNNISSNSIGFYLFSSSYHSFFGNNITKNYHYGIWLYYSSNHNSISGNNITNNRRNGVMLWNSLNNTVSRNEITNNDHGIYLLGASNNTISGNNITHNDVGIRHYYSNYNSIFGNNITNNENGIELSISSNNSIAENNITNNDYGIWLYSSSNHNSVVGNNIINNNRGIYLIASSNRFYHNNFIDNLQQVYITTYGYANFWDDGYPSGGNYWSDYEERYPDAEELDDSGIWDTPYVIDVDNRDRYPLMNPWTPTPPPKFRIGEWVQVTANLNVREGSGLSYTIISTMPEGTIGQIVGGPAEADSYVWWDVDYAVGVRGWSAENWLELASPPTCAVKLQKDGVEIDEVGVWEFFDIYVGDSTGDKGIKQVRFSSDNVQDGYPTGEWTEWYDWDVSSEDWDAATKIKRWAFATPGYKEVWAEVKDEAGYTAFGSANIFVPAHALPVLVSPLAITPNKEIYNIGDILEAEFTIKNIGDKSITLNKLLVGGRFNGDKLPDGEFPDFTFQTVTLLPGQPYQYQGSLNLTQQGNYRFFAAYYIENPTPQDKNLLDENNWNTNVELGEGLTHTDRVKNIIVYEEGTAPEEVSQLNETINRRIEMERIYPTYLLDPEVSWAASVWMTVSSIWTHAQEEYHELWLAGVDYDTMSRIEAIYARRFLDRGDIESAREHLQNSYVYEKISYLHFDAATIVFDGNMMVAMEAVKSALKLIEYGVTLTNPMAGKFASYIFMVPNLIADMELVGVEEAGRNLVRDLAFKIIFSEYKHPELDGRTFENYLNNKIGKITFPYIQEVFKNNEALQFYLSKALKEIAVVEGAEWLSEKAEELSEKIVDELSKRFESYISEKLSPVELRIYDSRGKITGVINGTARHGISRSFYINGTITILFPSDSYTSEVTGKEEGTYGLGITSVEAWDVTTFNAIGIPTLANAVHRYTVDWDALSRGEEGVTLQIDSDGDGIFEQTISADNELTQDEFMLQTATTIDFDPDTLNMGSNGNVVTVYIELPEGYDVSQIDVSSIRLNGTVPALVKPIEIGGYDSDGILDLMVKFDRASVIALFAEKAVPGNYVIEVTGTWADIRFEGTVSIRVISPP